MVERKFGPPKIRKLIGQAEEDRKAGRVIPLEAYSGKKPDR